MGESVGTAAGFPAVAVVTTAPLLEVSLHVSEGASVHVVIPASLAKDSSCNTQRTLLKVGGVVDGHVLLEIETEGDGAVVSTSAKRRRARSLSPSVGRSAKKARFD